MLTTIIVKTSSEREKNKNFRLLRSSLEGWRHSSSSIRTEFNLVLPKKLNKIKTSQEYIYNSSIVEILKNQPNRYKKGRHSFRNLVSLYVLVDSTYPGSMYLLEEAPVSHSFTSSLIQQMFTGSLPHAKAVLRAGCMQRRAFPQSPQR
jgi:hypothetical protein